MRSNLKGRYDFPTALDQQIEATQREVEKQEATIASLKTMVMRPLTPKGAWSIC